MIMSEETMKRVEQLKHNEDLLFKTIGYVEELLIKNNVGYEEEIEIFKKYLGFSEEDLDYLGIRDYDLEEELKKSEDLRNECYEIIKKYILNASEETLSDLYDWYNAERGDINDLIETMFESYILTYKGEELKKACETLIKKEA